MEIKGQLQLWCVTLLMLTTTLLYHHIHTTEGYSPPVNRRFFIEQHHKARSQPQPMFDAGFMRNMRGPPALRTMAGPPGSYSNIMEQEQKMDRWYVAPPGGYFGRGDDLQQADTVPGGERYPIGPPGSDAAILGRELLSGPPAAVRSYQRRGAAAAPPAPVS